MASVKATLEISEEIIHAADSIGDSLPSESVLI